MEYFNDLEDLEVLPILDDIDDYKEDKDILNYNNFSFIKNKNTCELLSFDYNYFILFGNELCEKVFKYETQFNSPFWLSLKIFCHPRHTMDSYIASMKILQFIFIEGWSAFVIKYLVDEERDKEKEREKEKEDRKNFSKRIKYNNQS